MAERFGRTGSGAADRASITRPLAVDQEVKRKASLLTPETFSIALGTSSTTIYTVRADEYFLLRKVVAANTAVSAVDLTLTIDGTEVISSQSVAANTTENLDAINGLLLDPEAVLAGLGGATGIRIWGWGVRIFGGDAWVL